MSLVKKKISGNHHLIRKLPIKGGKVFIFRPVCYGVAIPQLTFPFAQPCGCCGVDTISETPHVKYSEQFPLDYCKIMLPNQCWMVSLNEVNGLQRQLSFVTWFCSLGQMCHLAQGAVTPVQWECCKCGQISGDSEKRLQRRVFYPLLPVAEVVTCITHLLVAKLQDSLHRSGCRGWW